MKTFTLPSILLLSLASVQQTLAFNLTPPKSGTTGTTKAVFDPLSLADVDSVKVAQVAATSTLVAGLAPLAALAGGFYFSFIYVLLLYIRT